MIKYILYYISCDKSEVVMLESFFTDDYRYFVSGLWSRLLQSYNSMLEKFYVHTRVILVTETTYK